MARGGGGIGFGWVAASAVGAALFLSSIDVLARRPAVSAEIESCAAGPRGAEAKARTPDGRLLSLEGRAADPALLLLPWTGCSDWEKGTKTEVLVAGEKGVERSSVLLQAAGGGFFLACGLLARRGGKRRRRARP